MTTRIAAISLTLILSASLVAPGEKAPPAPKVDLKALFAEPVAAVDQDGKTILTKRAVGHPAVADYNGDGKADILLGCHKNMDTAAAEILVLENVGPAGKPRFQWPTAKSVKLADQEKPFSVSCGCKSGGTFEVFPTDWNGDGHVDLVVNTYWKTDGVRVLLNTGKSKTDPTFVRDRKLHHIGSHGRRSGSGDWTGDGIADLVFPVNHYGWQVYPGVRGEKGQITFADKPTMASKDYKMVGRKRWFDYSPHAWNFSGANPTSGDKLEIVAANDDPANKDRPHGKRLTHVELFILDRRAKTVTPAGRIWSVPAAYARLSVGDLNGDGCLDLLTTGGVFTKGEDTRIWVLYGKVKNVPAKTAAAKTK